MFSSFKTELLSPVNFGVDEPGLETGIVEGLIHFRGLTISREFPFVTHCLDTDCQSSIKYWAVE